MYELRRALVVSPDRPASSSSGTRLCLDSVNLTVSSSCLGVVHSDVNDDHPTHRRRPPLRRAIATVPERPLINREYDELRRDPLSPVSYSSFSLTPCSAVSVVDRQFHRRYPPLHRQFLARTIAAVRFVS